MDHKVSQSLVENELRHKKIQKITIRNLHNRPQITAKTTKQNNIHRRILPKTKIKHSQNNHKNSQYTQINPKAEKSLQMINPHFLFHFHIHFDN